MAVNENGAGHGGQDGPDLEGCTRNHCHGKRLNSDKACHQAAGRGTDHLGIGRCMNHGGKTPTHRKAAQMEMARHAAVTFGLPREVDPAQALLEEVHRTAGHVEWLRQVVAGLEQGELVWGLAEEIDRPATDSGGGGVETKHRAGINVWLQLYGQERDRLARVSKAAIDAGVSERIVSVFEQVGAAYVQVLEGVLDELGLSAEQRVRVPALVQSKLQAIAGGGAA